MTALALSALLAAAAAAVVAVPPPAPARLRGLRPSDGAVARAPRWRRRDLARERARAIEAAGVLAGELRAGRPAAAALAAAAGVAVGGTAVVLRSAAAAVERGGDVERLLVAGAPGCASPTLLRGLAACWSVCATSGAGLAAAVERLQEAERDAEQRRQAVRAELAGPRATAGLLAVLPLLGVALASALGAAPLRVLFGTPVGRASLVVGAVLDLIGVLWTRRLVARAVVPP